MIEVPDYEDRFAEALDRHLAGDLTWDEYVAECDRIKAELEQTPAFRMVVKAIEGLIPEAPQ